MEQELTKEEVEKRLAKAREEQRLIMAYRRLFDPEEGDPDGQLVLDHLMQVFHHKECFAPIPIMAHGENGPVCVEMKYDTHHAAKLDGQRSVVQHIKEMVDKSPILDTLEENSEKSPKQAKTSK